jgi:hypothetical protein
VNAEVPAGSTLYMLGASHNQMVYYLTSPIVPVGDPDELAGELRADTHIRTVFVLASQWTGATLARLGELEAVDRCKSLRTGESDRDRITLMRLSLRPK